MTQRLVSVVFWISESVIPVTTHALETDIILYRHQMEHELFIEKRLHTLIMGYGQATSVHDCVYVHMCIYMYTL